MKPETRKKYLEANKEKIAKQKKENYQKNKEQRIANQKIWNETNKEKIREYNQSRYKSNKLFQLKTNIKNLIGNSIKNSGYKKLSKTEQILGCTYEEFKIYIESKFEPWMNWDNRGNWNGIPTEINVAWDLDHIIPLSTAITEEDIIRLNHYTNFQPLCSYTNRHIKREKL